MNANMKEEYIIIAKIEGIEIPPVVQRQKFSKTEAQYLCAKYKKNQPFVTFTIQKEV